MAYQSPFKGYAGLITQSQPCLKPLQSESLPDKHAPTQYALDLATAMCFYLNWSDFGIKGFSKFRRNESWECESSALGIGICLGFGLSSTKNPAVIPVGNRDYLRKTFNEFIDGLGDLAIPNQEVIDNAAKFFIRILDLISSTAQRNGLKIETDSRATDYMQRAAPLVEFISSATAAVRTFPEFERAVPSRELWAPLFGPPQSALAPDQSRTLLGDATPQTSKQASEPTRSEGQKPSQSNIFHLIRVQPYSSGTQLARDNFAEWMEYCLRAARMMRIPPGLVTDLLPTLELANHNVLTPGDVEDELERLMPGRRQWLLDFKVRRQDFDQYWSAPEWVREFVARLPRRKLELEISSRMEQGIERGRSLGEASLFVPLYSLQPPVQIDSAFSIPIELFDRANRHMSTLDDRQYCDFMVGNELVHANQYIQLKLESDGL